MKFSLVPNSAAFSGTVTVDWVWLGGLPLSYSPGTQSLSVASGGSTEIHMTIGPLPDYVRSSRTLFIRYTIRSSTNPNLWASGGATMPLYLVYARPTPPQVFPWVGVLDDACTWAEFENTATDVARELTQGLYFAQRFAYSTLPGNRSHWTVSGDVTTFRLAEFLATPGWVSGNCVDVSDYLAICANSLGIEFYVGQHTDDRTTELTNEFDTNILCPIGDDPAYDSAYRSFTWIMHQFAVWFDVNVYDATAVLFPFACLVFWP